MAWLVVVVVLPFVSIAVAANPRREQLVAMYFDKGYLYQVILLFLAAFHGINMSMSTLIHMQMELEQSGCLFGYRSMWAMLKHKYRVVIPRLVSTLKLLLHSYTYTGRW